MTKFTFFLKDPVNGDEIQQHDSRFQQGVNAQYLHPYRLFGHSALLTFGSNFHDNQINVGLLHTKERNALEVATSAHAHVTNVAGYIQQGVDLLQQRLHLDAGLRFDYFRFDVNNLVDAAHSGIQGASRFQPKANLSYTPSARIPMAKLKSTPWRIRFETLRSTTSRPAARGGGGAGTPPGINCWSRM